jgi:hypothetical protein
MAKVRGPEIDLSKITLPMWGALIAGSAAAGAVLWYCISTGGKLLGLLALVGAIFGWVAGMLAAPKSENEKQHFGELAKVISGFVTGYLLSKLDPVIAALLTIPKGARYAPIMEAAATEQVLITLASFGIALLFVFSGRLYWSSEGEEEEEAARKKREAAIDAWIGRQPEPNLSRSEAIRRLIEKGLAAQ